MSEYIARNEKQLGAILRRARKQAGLTQDALGDHVHLRQAMISRLEAGEPTARLRTLMAMLAALDMELVVRRRSRGGIADFAGLF